MYFGPIKFVVLLIVLIVVGCSHPKISYSPDGFPIVADENVTKLAFVNSLSSDTTFVDADTIRCLECYQSYLVYNILELGKTQFLDTVKYEPRFCETSMSFAIAGKNGQSKVHYLVQDILLKQSYVVGPNGQLVSIVSEDTGGQRGFDSTDSLFVWISDSTELSLSRPGVYQQVEKIKITDFPEYKFHHDLRLHYPYISVLFTGPQATSEGGTTGIEEGILQYNLGTLEWKKWSVFDQIDSIGIPKSDSSKGFSGHSNSLDVDINGDYYISFRNTSQVYKISADLRQVQYVIGGESAVNLSRGKPFAGQHSIDIIEPDRFFLFDNGGVGRRVKSRIVDVIVLQGNNAYEVSEILVLPDSLSTFRMGSVQSLGDRLVVSVFNKGLNILEIDRHGRVYNHLKSLKSNAIKVLPVGTNNYFSR